MASLLRQIVAGPRARHPEAGLDLCYVTDNIIATSGPSGTYPQLAYRNPLKQLVKFLDEKHGDQWAIWEFRAEGTGYPDDEVYNRINHYPWPDHHPPPFALIPLIMASMRNWLKGDNSQASSAQSNGSQTTEDVVPVPEPRQHFHAETASPDVQVAEPDTSSSSDSAANGSSDLPSDGTDHSSLENSDGSRTNSLRQRKSVRWRESTILPPKEDREKLTPASDSHPTKHKHTNTKPASAPSKPKRVVVVHCKAGKGRSGTVSCSYLISQEGWSVSDAISRFTERRMRPGFGAGVSIPSQLRWISYVDRWTRHGKRYTERHVEILEVHVWGLRDRVKVSIEGFKDEGRRIEALHTFSSDERDTPDGTDKAGGGFAALVGEVVAQEHKRWQKPLNPAASASAVTNNEAIKQAIEEEAQHPVPSGDEGAKGDVVFRPPTPIVCESSDVNVDFERRNKGLSGMNMITSVAHVWFNAFFEGDGPERGGDARRDGVFAIEWDKMDGIKGSSRKGTRAFDKLAVVWRVVDEGREVKEPAVGEEVRQGKKSDGNGVGEEEGYNGDRDIGKEVQSSTESLPIRGKKDTA